MKLTIEASRMAATERILGSMQQSRSAMGSSAMLSLKPLRSSCQFERSYRRLIISSLQASMESQEDRGAALRKRHGGSSSRSSNVSSLLKAVQEGGSSAVLQQVSSIRHFFTPELPQAIIREIKKRMALPFKDQDDEENAIQNDLNGGLLEGSEGEQVTLLGPRCAWPRLTIVSTEGERQGEGVGGPRCAWPRVSQTRSAISSVQQGERASSTIGEGGRGANCAWPRVTSRRYHGSLSSRMKSPQEGPVTYMSSSEGNQNGSLSQIPQEGHVKKALLNSVQEGTETASVNHSVTEGPRCAWPRSTPRRMLATGVGLSLMNYLFIGQGAPALAILVGNPLPSSCEGLPPLSYPGRSLLS